MSETINKENNEQDVRNFPDMQQSTIITSKHIFIVVVNIFRDFFLLFTIISIYSLLTAKINATFSLTGETPDSIEIFNDILINTILSLIMGILLSLIRLHPANRHIQITRVRRELSYVGLGLLGIGFLFWGLSLGSFYRYVTTSVVQEFLDAFQLVLLGTTLLIVGFRYFYNKWFFLGELLRDTKRNLTTIKQVIGLLRNAPQIKNPKILFEVQGFRKLSLTMLFLVILAFTFSLLGALMALSFLMFLFVLSPSFAYRKLQLGRLPTLLALLLSSRHLKIINLIPGVDFKGEWFIELLSVKKKLNSLNDLVKFILGNWYPFFLLNSGFIAFVIRVAFFLKGDPPAPQTVNSIFDVIGTELIISFLLLPIFMAIYFVTVWVWNDAGLKVVKLRKRTTEQKSLPSAHMIVQLKPVSESAKYLLGLLVGFPALLWFADKSSQYDPTSLGGTLGAISILVALSLMTSGIAIFMGTMYYRSGVHQALVNEFRSFIIGLNLNFSDTSIKVRYLSWNDLTSEDLEKIITAEQEVHE